MEGRLATHIRLALRALSVTGFFAGLGWLGGVWHGKGQIWHKDHFEPFLAVLGAITSFLGSYLGERETPLFTGKLAESLNRRNRHQMIARVRHDWIEGVLERSLYRIARIDLGLEDRPDVVENPFKLIVQETDKPPRTGILKVFDQHASALLILGAPGSGKTTLLLELARDLLDRASHDENHQIPVVFNLFSLAMRHKPIDQWLAHELNTRYDVPYRIAQQWIANDQILPLLDGFDEVAEEEREVCLDSINAFRGGHGLVPIAICSRYEEYQGLTRYLRLHGSVIIQPLERN